MEQQLIDLTGKHTEGRHTEKQEKQFKWWIIPVILALIAAAGLWYYLALPAINIRDTKWWLLAIRIFFIMLVASFVLVPIIIGEHHNIRRSRKAKREASLESLLVFSHSLFVIGGVGTIVMIVIFETCLLFSSSIMHASEYQKLLRVEKSEFTEDITQISYDQIPLLDKDSAQILGERKMGSLVDLTSQYEVADEYTQINYKDNPVRVSPLKYASIIKWFTNKDEGVPAYIKIDMATQKTELVRLKEGMKYSPYDHFSRNLYRHLRFQYPSYVFAEANFEIDEEGVPYWVCGVKKFNIGLFGGATISKVVLCNAVSGECIEYDIDDVPSWVDKAYPASMLIDLYDYYGTLKHGFLNSILGQRDCLQTTNGYNYLAIDDDIWVYTGVTSTTSDQSNVGFVLMNQRTMETKYYEIEGAIEDSAMGSAEGKVQNLGYSATFPLLLNIDGNPTYFMALKDDAGLVKKYAMVSVQNYQIVATGDSVSECEKHYRSMIKSSNTSSGEEKTEKTSKNVSGTIKKIAQLVIDGSSHYYIVLDGSDEIYDIDLSVHLDAILLDKGDKVNVDYIEGTQTNEIKKIEKVK